MLSTELVNIETFNDVKNNIQTAKEKSIKTK